MGSLARSTLDFVKNLNMKGISEFFGGLRDKFGELKGKFSEGFVGKVQEKVADTGGGLADKAKDKLSEKAEGAVDGLGDKLAGTQDKTKNLNKGAGDSIASFFKGLTRGIKILGAAVKTQAFWLGIAGIAALGFALMPLGKALEIAAPGIEAFGTVITAVFAGLGVLVTAVADGFVKLLGALTMENIGPMLLLGPALFGIAAGLAAVSVAGLMALPAIGGLVALSLAAPALVSLGIGGDSKSAGEAKGKSEEGGMAALTEQFKTLIELVKQGTTINLDGTKIATSVNRNLPRVQTASS